MSAPVSNGRSGASSESGTLLCPNSLRSLRAAVRAHAVSRFVPNVTSPPAHRRTGGRDTRAVRDESARRSESTTRSESTRRRESTLRSESARRTESGC